MLRLIPKQTQKVVEFKIPKYCLMLLSAVGLKPVGKENPVLSMLLKLVPLKFTPLPTC